jgi:DNA polymerase III epsilon subunit family exonuclease
MLWIVLIIAAVVLVYYFLRRKPQKADISLLPEHFVVVDIETTGLDPEKHEIIEIGAVKVNRDSNFHTTLSALVKPSKKVSKKITELTGITDEMLDRDSEGIESAMNGFLEFIGDHRLVYYNAPFDHTFLTKAASLVGRKIENPVSCALDMSRRAWPGLKSYKLASLAGMGGLDTNGNHRALKDCELTMTVYAAAATKLGRIS